MTFLTNSRAKRCEWFSQAICWGLLAVIALVICLVGCVSKPKPPSTVKEFLSQPRPK